MFRLTDAWLIAMMVILFLVAGALFILDGPCPQCTGRAVIHGDRSGFGEIRP